MTVEEPRMAVASYPGALPEAQASQQRRRHVSGPYGGNRYAMAATEVIARRWFETTHL